MERKVIIQNNGRCVNSMHKARWLVNNEEESCQCIVSCKIVVSVEQNGHKSYDYVVTEGEYKELQTPKS